MQKYRMICVVNVVYVAACSVNNTKTQYKVLLKHLCKQAIARLNKLIGHKPYIVK